MNVSVRQYCFGRFYLRLCFRATEVYQQLNAQSGRADEAFNFLSPEGFFPFRQVPLSNVASIQRPVFYNKCKRRHMPFVQMNVKIETWKLF